MLYHYIHFFITYILSLYAFLYYLHFCIIYIFVLFTLYCYLHYFVIYSFSTISIYRVTKKFVDRHFLQFHPDDYLPFLFDYILPSILYHLVKTGLPFLKNRTQDMFRNFGEYGCHSCEQFLGVFECHPFQALLQGPEKEKVAWGEVWRVRRVRELFQLQSFRCFSRKSRFVGTSVIPMKKKTIKPGAWAWFADSLVEFLKEHRCVCAVEVIFYRKNLDEDDASSPPKHSDHAFLLPIVRATRVPTSDADAAHLLSCAYSW